MKLGTKYLSETAGYKKNMIDLGNKSLESEYFSNLKKNMTTVFVFLFHANTDQLKL